MIKSKVLPPNQNLWRERLGGLLLLSGKSSQSHLTFIFFSVTLSLVLAIIFKLQGLFFKINVLAALGLCCCKWAFSSCGEWGLLSTGGARASHRGGFSCCRARALEHGLSGLLQWSLKRYELYRLLIKCLKVSVI